MLIEDDLKKLPLIDVFNVVLDIHNTKIHTQKQLDLLIKNFEKYKFDVPIVIGTVKGKDPICVSGNGRVSALQKYSKETNKKIEIPYIIKDFKTIGERKTYSIKKNATHMETGYDNNELLNNLLYIKQEDINLYEDLKFNYESIKDIDFAEIKSVGEFDNDIVLDFDNEALESEKKPFTIPINYMKIKTIMIYQFYNKNIFITKI